MQLFDQTLSGSESRARIKLRDELAERAKLSEDRLTLLDEILPVLADAGIPDKAVGTLLRGKIGMSRLIAANAGATVRLPRDHGHLRLLEGSWEDHGAEFCRLVGKSPDPSEALPLIGRQVRQALGSEQTMRGRQPGRPPHWPHDLLPAVQPDSPPRQRDRCTCEPHQPRSSRTPA
ncbi:hypothetical protein [Streptomyces sp. SAJ15]|uniref:hypothetical protein n=1 Tax=Streptomyces sp. SAJ15 TaxID=2011095 RepID=UPI001643011C|nr:hypothetical protein [Streptomyces sp. SAJ15]